MTGLRTYIRGGLMHTECNGLASWTPDSPFEVDGIRYDPDRRYDVVRQPMISWHRDGGGTAQHWADSPLSEAQLDHYVATGYIPPPDRKS